MAYVKYYYDPSEPNGAYDENTLAGCVNGGEGYEKVDSSSSASTARKETIYFCIDGVPSGATVTKVQVDFQCKHLTWQNAGGLLYKTDLKWKPVILQNYSLSGSKITSVGSDILQASLASIYSKTGTFTSYTSKSYNSSFSKTVSGSNLVGVAFEIGSYNTLGDIHFWFKAVNITVTYTEPHYHTTEIRNAASATCTTKGYTGDTYCKTCGEKISGGSEIAALGHSFGSTTSAKAATCLATGNTAYKQCTRCKLYFTSDAATNSTAGKDNTSSFVINKLNHSYTGAIRSDGNGKTATHSFKCVNGCNNYGGAVTHTWNAGSITTQPTCTATGVKTYTCTASGCGATYTETVPSKGHTEVTDKAVAATCTTTGLTEGKHCSVCNAVIVAQTVIPALGHSFTNYTSNNDATCTKDGTKTAKCDRCNATDTVTDVGSALGHNYVSKVYKPTETSHGYTRHTCSRCGDYYDTDYTYLVRWYNEDGSVLLETDQSVPHGTMPNCSVTPAKAATAQYSYTHSGWAISPTAETTTALTAVVANIKYYARFTRSTNTYTVTWKNDNGTTLETDTLVPYGTPPDYNGATPTKASTAQYDYTFLGWSAKVEDPPLDEGDLPTVSGNIIYTAVYLPVVRSYNLDIVTYDCTVDGAVSGTYEYGKSFTVKVNPDFGYEFDKIIDESNDIEYESNELTFIITGNTTLLCLCKRVYAPIFASSEQQVKEVYIVPEINTIVYVIDGVLPTLTTTAHTVDDLHFSVINIDIDSSEYANYQYYPIEQLYVNDKNGIRTRIW